MDSIIFIAEQDENGKIEHVWFQSPGCKPKPLTTTTRLNVADAEFYGASKHDILRWIAKYLSPNV